MEPDEAVDRVPDPAIETEHAAAVAQALMVALDALTPAERLAFCLHDLSGSFEEIAPCSAAALPPAVSSPAGPGAGWRPGGGRRGRPGPPA